MWGISGIVLADIQGAERRFLALHNPNQPTNPKKLKTPSVRVILVLIIALFESPPRRTSKIRAKDVKNMCLSQLLLELIGTRFDLYGPAMDLMNQPQPPIQILRDLVYARCLRMCSTKGMQAAFKRTLLRCDNKPAEFNNILRAYLRTLERKKKRGKKSSKRRSATKSTTAPK
jgi:hypothetical protein